MKLIVVICHYRENLNWLKDLKHPYIVYNKNPNNNHLFENNLPNVGFDTVVYLKYIIDNYNNLPDYICFSQDNPFYHCSTIIDKINNFNFDSDFVPLGISYVRDQKDILEKTIKYAEENGIKLNIPIKFINSAQCIVSKKLILKNTKEFYEKIKETLPKNEIINQTNYIVEYLWPTILGFNEELKISFYNC
jgi:hypothetical protein